MKRPYPVGEQKERNAEIWRKRKMGMTYRAIGKEYGLSRDRIKCICDREAHHEANRRRNGES